MIILISINNPFYFEKCLPDRHCPFTPTVYSYNKLTGQKHKKEKYIWKATLLLHKETNY